MTSPKNELKSLPFMQFTGGINTSTSTLSVPTTDFLDAQDIDLYPLNGFSKRSGYLLIGTPASGHQIWGMYGCVFSNGDSYLISVSNGKIFFDPFASGSPGSGTGALLTDGNLCYFAMLSNQVIICDGVDQVVSATQALSASVLTGLNAQFSTCQFPFSYRGYMFYLVPTTGAGVQYDTAYFSNVNDPTTSSANNFINVAPGTGVQLFGAVDLNTYAYFFKRDSIYQVSYSPTAVDANGDLFPFTINPNPITQGIGTNSPRAIVKFTTPITHPTPGVDYCFFIDQLGNPRIFDGTTTINLKTKVSQSTDIKSTITLDSMDSSRLFFAHAVNYTRRNRIKFFMTSTNVNGSSTIYPDTCWVLDYNYGFSIMRYNYYNDSSGTPFIYSTSVYSNNTNGLIATNYPYDNWNYLSLYGSSSYFQLDSTTSDNGNAISPYVVIGDIHSGNIAEQIKYHFMKIRGNNNSGATVSVAYYVAGQTTAFRTDTFTLYLVNTTDTVTNYVDEIMHTLSQLRIKISPSNGVNDTFSCDGLVLVYEPMGITKVYNE